MFSSEMQPRYSYVATRQQFTADMLGLPLSFLHVCSRGWRRYGFSDTQKTNQHKILYIIIIIIIIITNSSKELQQRL